ncbi:hypothetical protein L3Q82_026134, partial [Scortum barcoo]
MIRWGRCGGTQSGGVGLRQEPGPAPGSEQMFTDLLFGCFQEPKTEAGSQSELSQTDVGGACASCVPVAGRTSGKKQLFALQLVFTSSIFIFSFVSILLLSRSLMAAASKSSQTAKNVVIALLALWSIISLIVIVVWATSPDLKSSAQCRAELEDVMVRMEGAAVVWNKNKAALEEMVEAGREEQARQQAEILLLLGRLNATNATLEECRQENAVLNVNISVLQENIEQLHQTEANLTAQLGLKEDHIELLEQNVTQTQHQTTSCFSLKAAAESHMVAAQSQTKACEARQQYLQKQLQKCKDVDTEAPQQTQQDAAPPSPGAASPLAGLPALMLLVCSALHLITCELQHSHECRKHKTPAAPERTVSSEVGGASTCRSDGEDCGPGRGRSLDGLNDCCTNFLSTQQIAMETLARHA